ncbi:hypothetical protein ACTWJ8_40255 (plasmid) [Streptomyces sp. SDT5-1]|uniref:hypothetical protein n=1 Tax=Streptomyces sp. SDT5-1 TaxID=3406418 RepID=UPI003FD36250
MTITTTAIFLIIAACLGFWMWRDSSFKKKEFIAVSLFWIAFAATPWGADLMDMMQSVLGTGADAASNAVNNVSSR